MTSFETTVTLIGGPTVHMPPRGNDERFKRAGVELAHELLGWQPTVRLEDGIGQLRTSLAL